MTAFDEYLVPEEVCSIWYMDAPRNKGVPHDVMRAEQRVCCRDVQVMGGTNCWPDHTLVRAKLRLELPRVHCSSKKIVLPISVQKFVAPAARDEYRSQLENVLENHPYEPDLSSGQALRAWIVSAAERVVGRRKRNQPEWFEENAEELMALIAVKNEAHVRMLNDKSASAKKEFRRQQ